MIKSAKDRHERWTGLSAQWKQAFNQCSFGKGPVETKPSGKELKLLCKSTHFRFSGPDLYSPI